MITTLKTIPNSDGTKHRTGIAREISVIVKGNPVKQVKVGVAEVKSNYNVENGFVRRYNSFEYGTTDLVNTYASVEKNSYIHSQNIDENFDANNIVSTRLNRDGYHELVNSRLYTVYYTSAFYPSAGDWPSPVFLKTAQTIKNGNQLVIGTKGSIIKFYNNSTYSGDPIYQATVDGNVTAVYNLLPKTTYYYRVLDSLDNILFSGSFTTEGNTRFIRLALVHNVRDCGGWKTIDGSKRFKYGLVFRGGQFNSGFYNNPTALSLTKVANELKLLGVKQTINLRGDDYETNVSNAFGNDITMTKIGSNNNFDFTNLYSNTTVINHFLNSLRIVVNTLQLSKSVYVHCQLGRDRTGGFISVLEALCDISENGIIKDYELTSSATLVTTRSTFLEMWNGFKNGYSDSNYPTILSKVLKWFIDKYNALTANTYRIKDSNGNYITDGQTALNTVKALILENISSEDPSQEDDVYITQINDDSFTGNPTRNGNIFTWPLKITLSDGTVTTYANYRNSHSNYGDATSLVTGNNAKAPNEGYIDSNGNLTYDLSKDNYVLDSTYLGTITLPCLTDSSNTVTKEFSKIQKCVMTNNSTPFDTCIANDYTFTTVSSYELSYHASGSGSDPDVGTVEISNWPQESKDDYSVWRCAKELPNDCIVRITNPLTGLTLNNIVVLNTNTALTLTTYGTANGIFTNTNTSVYNRDSYRDINSNCKLVRILRNQKAYIRNKTELAHSYLVVFGRDDLNCLIEIGTPKTSS